MDVSVLSNGSIQTCIDGRGPPRPCLQVLGIKKIQSDGRATGDRYRLQLSDGVHYQPGMMATQMNSKVESGELDKFSIIQVEKLIVNTVQSRKIMILINLSVMHNGSSVGKVLGSPKNLEITHVTENNPSAPPSSKPLPQKVPRPPPNQNQPSHATFGTYQRPSNFAAKPLPQQPVKNEQKTPTKQFYGAQTNTKQYGGSPSFPGVGGSPLAGRNIFPIASLNPYQNKWTIKARVTNKPNMRTYSNSRGEGRIMSVELVDQSGEIKGTAFNEDADRLYPIVELNKVYLVSRGRLKPANRTFNACNHEYEITFSSETQIEECFDGASDLPTVSFNFRPISSLEQIPKDTLVDVIGVCTACPDVQTIVTKTTNRKVSKRDLTLADKSGRSISCTIWGAEAEGFDGSNRPILAFKGVRTSEFNGVTLSCVGSTAMSVDPDIQEAHELRGWYESYGKDQLATSLSTGGSFNSALTPFLTTKQVSEADIGKKEKPDYFNTKAAIIFMRKENFMYKACPKPECNKKVVEDSSERYLCEKCGYQGPEFKYRMILKLNVADYSSNLFVDCFNESSETILGISAQELGELKDQPDTTRYEAILEDASLKQFIFKVRAKMDTYNEEQRLRCSAVNVTPVNFSQECRRRLDEIKMLMAK